MNSQTTTQIAADEGAIRAVHQRMIEAWNAGDAAAFAAPFTDEANFIAFEETHLRVAGRSPRSISGYSTRS